jgi:hypothetical protein
MQIWSIARDTFSEPNMMAIIVSPSGCQVGSSARENDDMILREHGFTPTLWQTLLV